MNNYREIVTKAVIGKAKKTTTNTYKISTNESPNTVLGCWVINHQFNGANNNGKVEVNGSFDVNVWYSYDNDTKTSVTTERVTYQDTMNVTLKNDTRLDNTSEIIVRGLHQPTVSEVNIENGIVNLKIEKELGVEIVGNTKVKVSVEEFDDDYEELIDEELDNTIDSIEDNFIEE